MTSFLFPIADLAGGVRSKNDVAPFLSDIARATLDSADALDLFKDLIEGKAGGPESNGFMAFDAHGGDAGCQLRAGMMQEVFLVYRYINTDLPEVWVKFRALIDTYTTKLRQIHENAKEACKDIITHKVHPKVYGGPTEDTLKMFGWDTTDASREEQTLGSLVRQALVSQGSELPPNISFLAYFLQDSEAGMSDQESSRPSSSDSSSTGTLTSTYATEYDFDGSSSQTSVCGVEDTEKLRLGPLATHHGGVDSKVGQSIARVHSFFKDTLPMMCSWDPMSVYTLTRFVVFCYVLSKYKAFSIVNDTVGARTAPEDAAEVSYSFIRPYTGKKKVPGKPQRILRELRELQSWMSDLSCAWQKSLAQRSVQNGDMEQLIVSTMQESDKGLKSMACYPGYLLLRESWASMNCTLLLVDRHFCPSGGFHYNVFLATMKSPAFNACPCQRHPLGVQVAWSLERIQLTDLIQDSDSISPHLTIMGNSISGGHTEYMKRFGNKSRPHTADSCAENEAHVEQFLSADHDRLALAFFASHDSYAFPVSDAEGAVSGTAGDGHGSQDTETAFVGNRIDLWADRIASRGEFAAAGCARTLKESWLTSRREADEMGTGHDGMHTFTWQHALLETKARVAKRIERWMEIGELMPLHAPVGERRQ
ncbi:hypothetical protein VPNG_01289 [Cytospora leucostoma]|uniref:Uncharacterized protein n=1 Tax=Cytospora leucostoma TaxID=1230097 RepID=A0A423XM98_9PEZI|nr:hypothetical protein VPNG_01289 [Cytospora leucostoma]